MNNKKYYIYSVLLFVIFIAVVSFFGIFKIGILSDTFGDAYTAVNSSIPDKITNNLQYIDEYRYRPVLFLALQGIVNIQTLLGIPYDNFILYKLVNLILYILFAFISGLIVLKFTSKIKLSLITELLVLIYPNNLHNLCWSAAYFEILCGIFYLLAFFVLLKYLNEKKLFLLLILFVLFVLALLTKETAVTFPFVCILLIYLIYGKETIYMNKYVFISLPVILIAYFISKTFLSISIPVVSAKYFQGDFWMNSLKIIFKGIIAILIPLDFSILRIGLKDFNILVLLYILLIIFFGLIVLYDLMRNKKMKTVYLLVLLFLILISPNVYAGYIRGQLILLPFTVMLIVFVSTISFNLQLYKKIIISLILFWLFWGYGNIDGWKFAYTESKGRMDNLLKTDFIPGRRNIIMGNPARMQQYFMYDNIMFTYNYFKYGKFIIKDTLSDILRTVSLDKESLNGQINVVNIGYKEYELFCTGKTQFFYLDGDEKEIKNNNGIKNNYMTTEFLDYNYFGKPIKLKIKILSENTDCFIFQGQNLIKLN